MSCAIDDVEASQGGVALGRRVVAVLELVLDHIVDVGGRNARRHTVIVIGIGEVAFRPNGRQGTPDGLVCGSRPVGKRVGPVLGTGLLCHI